MNPLFPVNEQNRIDELLTEAHTVRTSNPEKSVKLAEKALDLSKQYNITGHCAKSHSRLSFYLMILGQYERSLHEADLALKIFQVLSDDRGIADVKFNMASVYYKSDNLHLGLRYVTEALTVYRRFEDSANEAKCLKVLGTIYEYFNDIDKAIEANEACIAAADKAGDINMKTNAFNPLSGIYLNRGNIEKATALIEQSILLKQQTGDLRGVAFALYGRGKIFAKRKKYREAEKDFNTSLEMHREMGEKLGACMVLYKLGSLYYDEGKPEMAKEALQKGLSICETYSIQMLKTKITFLLYRVYKNENDTLTALRYLEKYQCEQEAMVHNQAQQIVNSYTLIHKIEAEALEKKLQAEKAEMLDKKNKAEYSAKVRQDFLSNMSHEIRTPLNAIITISGLLKEKDDPEEQQLLESLKFASGNLLLLINDILDLSKLEDGKVTVENKPSEIRKFAQNITNTFEGLAQEKGLEMKLEIDPVVRDVYCFDATKLTQVLGNLLSNAIKFTEKGSVELRISKQGDTPGGSLLQFSVTDTGIGIEENFLPDLFKTFTQAKSATIKKEKGSGLGLAIVQKLTALFGGEVQVQTNPSKGSTFFFTIELKYGELVAENKAEKRKDLSRLKVLVVDDNPINLLVCSKLLSRWGITADTAKNGVDAISRSGEKNYDIILMDIHMPEMNGYDASRNIKTNSGLNMTTPVYALTADITANLDNEYKPYFEGFLRKPIEPVNLYSALSGLCV